MSDLSQLAQIADLHAYRVSEITACFGDNGILTGQQLAISNGNTTLYLQ